MIDAVHVTGVLVAGLSNGAYTFDASAVPTTQGDLTIRFNLHDLLNSCESDADGTVGWAEIRSTADQYVPGTGVTVNGDVVSAPVPVEAMTWGGVKVLLQN